MNATKPGHRPAGSWVIHRAMRELLRTNDVVLISFTRWLMSEAGVMLLVADEHASIMEGQIGILPRRLMVPDEAWPEAVQILRDAGIELEKDDRS
jgi:hypothetical protein